MKLGFVHFNKSFLVYFVVVRAEWDSQGLFGLSKADVKKPHSYNLVLTLWKEHHFLLSIIDHGLVAP